MTGLTDVSGVPETLLGRALLAALPRSAPPPPWTVECDAVLWATRPGGAGRALPPRLRGSSVTVVVGGMVRYSATPVGPYAEVLGAVGGVRGARPWGSVAFMAVDSPSSLVAGRLNWALPKTLGVIDGSPGAGAVASSAADGHRWRVAATPRPLGPTVPLRGGAMLRQQAGAVVLTSHVRATGRLRPALVRVAVESDGQLAGWLRPGRHAGAVLTGVRLRIEEPRG